jgi:hypothetical protein
VSDPAIIDGMAVWFSWKYNCMLILVVKVNTMKNLQSAKFNLMVER